MSNIHSAFLAEQDSCVFRVRKKSFAMRKKGAISITAVAVFFLLSDFTLKDHRGGKNCSFFSFFQLGENLIFFTLEQNKKQKRKWFLFIIEILIFSITKQLVIFII